MNADGIQTRVNFGYTKVAQIFGRAYDRYRPISANDPISDITFEGQQLAYFDTDADFSTSKVSKPATPYWFGSFNAADVLPGDYFRSDAATYFVGIMQDFLPPEMIACNMVLSVYRPTAATPANPERYRGGNSANQGHGAPLALNWPASVLEGTKGDKAIMELPNDVKTPWFKILMPAIPGVYLQTTDQVFDEHGRRYAISSPVADRHGYRMTAMQSEG